MEAYFGRVGVGLGDDWGDDRGTTTRGGVGA